MSYRFNQLTGRLVGAAKSVGQGLKPAGPESSGIIYDYNCKFKKVDNPQTRHSSSAGGKFGPMSKRMLDNYAKFQKDDGVPVHLKGGFRDQVLYYSTVAICTFGLFEMFRNFYIMAFPQKKED